MKTKEELLRAAAQARGNAYAPYSDFRVGAALLTASGEVFRGCNVECASFGLSNCAERTALFAAVAAGHRQFAMLALSLPGAGMPCGACRQILREFAPALPVVVGDERGSPVRETTLDRLLPESFGPGDLGR
jgi:cytidine deaminase